MRAVIECQNVTEPRGPVKKIIADLFPVRRQYLLTLDCGHKVTKSRRLKRAKCLECEADEPTVETEEEGLILHFRRLLPDGKIECSADVWGTLIINGTRHEVGNSNVTVLLTPKA